MRQRKRRSKRASADLVAEEARVAADFQVGAGDRVVKARLVKPGLAGRTPQMGEVFRI
jgi:hypothetical protein